MLEFEIVRIWNSKRENWNRWR